VILTSCSLPSHGMATLRSPSENDRSGVHLSQVGLVFRTVAGLTSLQSAPIDAEGKFAVGDLPPDRCEIQLNHALCHPRGSGNLHTTLAVVDLRPGAQALALDRAPARRSRPSNRGPRTGSRRA
jgi:hypothetical protein